VTSIRVSTRHRRASRIPNVLLAVALALTCLIAPSANALAGDASPANADAVVAATRLFLPIISHTDGSSDTGAHYETVPVVESSPDGRPAALHGDLNLALRSYSATSATLGLVNYGGDTDSNAPQLAGIFADRRLPGFASVHRVYDWDWDCSADGCRGAPISYPPVTLLGLQTRPGELLSIPSRAPEIFGGGYKALVLYAEPTRITLVYTRNDHVKAGYTVHLEGVSVDSDLLALYRQANAAGRSSLPALHNDQPLGMASGYEIRVAIRDRGSFLDPRSRKDWWQGY